MLQYVIFAIRVLTWNTSVKITINGKLNVIYQVDLNMLFFKKVDLMFPRKEIWICKDIFYVIIIVKRRYAVNISINQMTKKNITSEDWFKKK